MGNKSGYEKGAENLAALVGYIEALRSEGRSLNLPDFKIAQIKQKFDELRCYTEGEEGNREVAAIITQAQDLAARTCERCGNPIGHLRCQQYLRGRAHQVFDVFGDTGFNVDHEGGLNCYRTGSEFRAEPGDWILGFRDGSLRVSPWPR